MVMTFDWLFLICPTDLLICVCSSGLYKLLTNPTLFLAELMQILLPSPSCTQQENYKGAVLFTYMIFLLPHITISLYKCTLPLISQSWLFLLRFRGFVSFTISCSLRKQNNFLWSDSGLKWFAPVLSSLSVICCYPYPTISASRYLLVIFKEKESSLFRLLLLWHCF